MEVLLENSSISWSASLGVIVFLTQHKWQSIDKVVFSSEMKWSAAFEERAAFKTGFCKLPMIKNLVKLEI
jgi:hypothetical protein